MITASLTTPRLPELLHVLYAQSHDSQGGNWLSKAQSQLLFPYGMYPRFKNYPSGITPCKTANFNTQTDVAGNDLSLTGTAVGVVVSCY